MHHATLSVRGLSPAIHDSRRVPRALHPVAWWIWALGLVIAVNRTTNPLLLILTLSVLGFVVASRRTDAPWARAFKYYLMVALFIIVVRIVFQSVFASGIEPGDHVLFELPHIRDAELVRRSPDRRAGDTWRRRCRPPLTGCGWGR